MIKLAKVISAKKTKEKNLKQVTRLLIPYSGA
jgi:hypothetical protein